MSYFTTLDGRKIYYRDVAEAIEKLHPELVGEHIFKQVDRLGLWQTFQDAHTPYTLPYSFSEYRE